MLGAVRVNAPVPVVCTDTFDDVSLIATDADSETEAVLRAVASEVSVKKSVLVVDASAWIVAMLTAPEQPLSPAWQMEIVPGSSSSVPVLPFTDRRFVRPR